jgi:hypothetical protein
MSLALLVQTASWRWLNNGLINFVSSIVGSLMAGFLGWLVS